MTYQRVSSSCLAEIAYDPSAGTLAVRFHSGREYRYRGIPPETYQALVAAASLGRYFNARIRDGYPYVRVE